MEIPISIWRKEHLAVLESIFPEVTDSTDVNTVLVNQGKRRVVHFVREQLRKQEHHAKSNQVL